MLLVEWYLHEIGLKFAKDLPKKWVIFAEDMPEICQINFGDQPDI